MQKPVQAGEEAAFPVFENKNLMQAHAKERTRRPARKALRRRLSQHVRGTIKTLCRMI